MDTLYTFLDNITHYKTESVHFLGLMNSATKNRETQTRVAGLSTWDVRLDEKVSRFQEPTLWVPGPLIKGS